MRLIDRPAFALRVLARVMIAAIYARKSTEQHGVVDEQKSTARQVDPREELNERESSTEL